MQIRTATHKDVPRLKTIWDLCFPDGEEYIDLFFRLRFKPEEALVLEEEENGQRQIAAMLFMPPASVGLAGTFYPAAYIYAVATHPDAQGKGFSTRLLAAAHDHLQAQGMALSLLAPGSKSLFDFYRNRGFVTAFSMTEYTVPAKEGNWEGQMAPADPAAYHQAREAAFHTLPLFVRWQTDAVVHQQALSATLGGGVMAIEAGGHNGFAIVEKEKNTLLFKELIWPKADFTPAVQYLLRILGGDTAKVRLPVGEAYPVDELPYPCEVVPRAMAKWYIPTPKAADGFADGYLAFIME